MVEPMTAGQPAVAQAQAGQGIRRAAVLVLALAQLMFLVDATIINVALPSIQQAMRLPGPVLEWMVTGYALPFGGLLLLGGRAGDILGRRRVFAGGLTLFTAASLLGGMALTPAWLLVCRAAQGIGAAAAYPAAIALITAAFPEGAGRHRALGTLNVVAGSGGAIGFLAGGLITTYLSWRWVMLVNVPIGVFLVVAIPRVLPETPGKPGRFDVAGAVTITAGLTLAVYGLISGAASEKAPARWGDPAVAGSLAAAALLVIAFVLIERRSRRPMVPLRVFADLGRSASYVVTVLLNTSMFGIFFFLTLFVQRVWGLSPLQTALVYAPLSVVIMAASWAAARLVTRFGVRPVVLTGLAAAAGGMVWMSRIGSSSGYATGLLIPGFVTYGGIGLTTVPLTLTSVARIAREDSGLASGVFSAARQLGGATGLAVLGTVTWGTVAAAHALTPGVERGFLLGAAITGLALLIMAVADPRPGPAPGPAAKRAASE
jgi:EmrB/QacA subfamily drug resistance transporter